MAKGLQAEEFLCGPASLQKAFKMHGVKVSQHKIASVAGTTEEDGTSEKDIIRAIGHFGFEADEYQTDSWEEAINWLDNNIILCAPSLLCVRVQEAYDHWVCCYGGLGGRGTMRYIISDPGNWAPNFEEYGSNMYTRRDLLKYWRAPKRERDPGDLAYYGIAVHGRRKQGGIL